MSNKFLPTLVKSVGYSRKVKVADIKQYLVDEFKITKDLTKENRKLHKAIKEFKKIEDKYNLTLITLDEYKDRINDKNEIIKEMNKDIKELNNQISLLINEKNDLIIKNKVLDKSFNETKKKLLKTFKNDLVNLMQEQKGILSKTKIIELIKNIKESKDE